jgi:tripartite motif-containing protein 71
MCWTWVGQVAGGRGRPHVSSLTLCSVYALVMLLVVVLGLGTTGASAEPSEPYGIKAWGLNVAGGLGIGTETGPEHCRGFKPCSAVPVSVAGVGRVKAVSVGGESVSSGGFGLALLKDGTVRAWGNNTFGQLGDGTENNSFVPVPVRGLSGVTAIAAGGDHSLALLSDGTVMAWGNNEYGQLGIGNDTGPEECVSHKVCSKTPVIVSGLSEVTAIAAAGEQSYALLKDGTVVAWGSNDEGQLGDGTNEGPEMCKVSPLVYEQPCSKQPTAVDGLSNVTAIAAGRHEFALALLENHTVMAWGASSQGRLGDGKATGPESCLREWEDEHIYEYEHEGTPCSKTPIAVEDLSEVTAITAGWYDSAALLSNGTVKAWGLNNYGELGDGTNTGPESCGSNACSLTPVEVSGLSEVTAIAAGGSPTTLALLANGTVKTWGDNTLGQLGDGFPGPETCGYVFESEYCSRVPVTVSDLKGVEGIATGAGNGVDLSLAFGREFPNGMVPQKEELFGPENPGEPGQERACVGKPVNCATGNEVVSQTDVAVDSRGVGLNLTRTYNAQEAAVQHTPGPFGYGWSASFSDHLVFNEEAETVTVVQANGSTVTFSGAPGVSGELEAPEWAQAKLVCNGDGTYAYTLPDQTVFLFDSSGQLLSETDRNGNVTTMTRGPEGRLESVTDPAGRKLTFAYNREGQVESVTDPMGQATKYEYEGGNLVSVTPPGQASPRWRFGYDSSNRLTKVTNGNGGTTTNTYDGSNRVESQQSPTGATLRFVYEPHHTTISNSSTRSLTEETFNADDELSSIVRGAGTASETTETFTYNGAGYLTSVTNGDKQTTEYVYDGEGNRTSMVDPDKNETKWGYDSRHDVISETAPNGETTTIERDSSGNAISVSRPAPGSKTQIMKYEYDPHGDLTSMTNPLGYTWKYGYDSRGDRTSETDPEGNKRTWEYNEDSQEVATVSPRGNAEGAEASKYTTTIERDAQGRPVAVIEPEPAEASGGPASPDAPSNTASPTISGATQDGDTLSATTGVWEGAPPLTYTYQWQSCNALGGGCLDILGANTSTYVLGDSDVGTELEVTVTATNSVGSASSTSSPTAVVSAEARTAPTYSYLAEFGAGKDFSHPGGVAVDSKGDLWVADKENNRIVEFNPEGEYIRQFGSMGSGEGQLKEPYGVAVDTHGDVWVLDTGNDRIEEFTEEGKYIRAVGSRGSGVGQFDYPEGIAVSPHGDVLVSDTYNQRVEEFNEDGEYLKEIGVEGEGRLNEPEGVAVDSHGDIWVADWTNKVEEFNEEGVYIKQIGSAGSGTGEFEHPYGITVDSKGHVLVGDFGNTRIDEFNEEGEYVSQFGEEGTGPGQFSFGYPMGLAATSEGDIWVADSRNNRVEEFSEKGEYLKELLGTGGPEGSQLNRPGGVALDSKGNVWVLDTGHNRIAEYSKEGRYLHQFGSEGSGMGQFEEPLGIAIDSENNIWVLDSGNDRVEEFNEKGEYLKEFGSVGLSSGQFLHPEGIAVDSHGNVWISDTYNDRVQEFNKDGEYLKTIGEGGLEYPKGIAVDGRGDVWVTDWREGGVEEFNKEGEYVKQIGSEGSGDGQLEGPYGIAIGPEGNIWVGDTWNDRIEEFNPEGEYIGQFGKWGSEPGGLELEWPDGLAISPNGDIWVTDTSNNRIEEWASVEAPSNVIAPSISGQAVDGQTLSARTGAWKGTPTISYTYQWQGCNESGTECHDIEGATSSSYLLTSGNLGTRVQVLITATNATGSTSTTSSSTMVVIPAASPSTTAAPTVSGALQEDQTLNTTSGTWTGAPSPTYAYQWQRCNSSGESCTNITGATYSAHVLGHSDVEHTLRVIVTATNTAGSASSTSAATATITSLTHETRYTYDTGGNLTSVTDPDGHTTTYTYNAENQPIKVRETNGTTTETGYNGTGQVISQTDGDGHTTKYVRNVLGEVTEIIDPLHRRTIKEYDAAGNLIKVTDPAKRTTTYTYDPANRLAEVSYSDGTTPDVKYEYDTNGNRTSMTDGTGTTTYAYDQLDRLTKAKDGHGDTASYEYNLADEQTKVTYPNSKSVEYTYDNDGRMHSLTDWLQNTTTFTYDPDSNLTATTFPSSTGEEDLYTYDEDDQMSGVEMKKGGENLASLAYGRNKDGQLTGTVSKDLPGEEEIEDTYDANGRLAQEGSTTYKYDPANNPVQTGSSTNTYTAADELEKSTGIEYASNELGERTKTIPSSGPTTTYGYDQAGNLTSVKRPEEGSTPKIEDTYTYNGEGLRASQTINGTTSYFTWNTTGGPPVLLDGGANSYIYGPENLPVEQINNEDHATFLHHDQAGSTRLLTNEKGEAVGKCSYSAYGALTCEGSATTPLGYDGQYTNSDTGLIYLRAREYDPSTAQFLSRDPLEAVSGEPYAYAADNPLNIGDPTGLLFGISLPSFEEIGEGIAGWGDMITFGATNWIREELGDNNIESCTDAYQTGGIAGLVTGVLIPGEGEAEIGAEGLDEALAGLKQSKANIYEVDSVEELQTLYDELSHGGEPATPHGYDGEMVELPNGTRVGLRNTSRSGGPALDIHQPGQPRITVHLPES